MWQTSKLASSMQEQNANFEGMSNEINDLQREMELRDMEHQMEINDMRHEIRESRLQSEIDSKDEMLKYNFMEKGVDLKKFWATAIAKDPNKDYHPPEDDDLGYTNNRISDPTAAVYS